MDLGGTSIEPIRVTFRPVYMSCKTPHQFGIFVALWSLILDFKPFGSKVNFNHEFPGLWRGRVTTNFDSETDFWVYI